MLRLWMQQAGDRATGNALEKALNSIGRDDIVAKCIGNVAPVTDASEKIIAQTHVDQAIKALENQIIQPLKSEKRNLSLDVSYDEQDLMKVSCYPLLLFRYSSKNSLSIYSSSSFHLLNPQKTPSSTCFVFKL